MRRQRISIRATSALALLGLIMSSTVVVWAMPCGDECRSDMAEHSCCASDLQPTEDTRATTTECCGGSHMHCDRSIAFAPDSACSAHDRSRDVAVERIPTLLPLERISRILPNERAGPARPLLVPIPTKTIVLLL